MPSASVLEQKKQIVASVADRINNSCAGVIVDYKGISVADDTALRKELREAGVEYTVVKNTLLKLAINGTSLESMGEVLDGTTALATSKDDYVAAARILNKYAEDHENFKLKAGYLDGEVMTMEKLKDLANLPSEKHCSLWLQMYSAHLSQALLVLFRLSPIRQRLPLRLNCQRN